MSMRAARLSDEQSSELAAQIAAMARAGLPLAPGLRAAAEELRGRLALSLRRLADDLDQGIPLDEAMASQRHRFPPHLRTLILASVQHGRLATVLHRFVATQRSRSDVQRQIWANLAYPIALVLLVLCLLVLFAYGVVPQVSTVAHDVANWFGGPRGANSLEITLLVAKWLFWTIGTLVLGGLAFWSIARLGAPSAWLYVKDALPVLGPISQWSRIVQFLRLMAMLIDEAIPLPEALRMAGQASGEPPLARACRTAASRVETGRPLAESLADLRLFPPTLQPFIQWGQSTSNLADAFRAAADSFEGRIQRQIVLLESIAIPLVSLLVAATVVLLVSALLQNIVAMIGNVLRL